MKLKLKDPEDSGDLLYREYMASLLMPEAASSYTEEIESGMKSNSQKCENIATFAESRSGFTSQKTNKNETFYYLIKMAE